MYVDLHPSVLVAFGLQDGGKSHTTGVVVENCVLADALMDTAPLIHRGAPMAVVTLHYDTSSTSVSELIGLCTPSRRLPTGVDAPAPLCPTSITVLVSPFNYKERKRFYDAEAAKLGVSICVKRLVLDWHNLTADQIKVLLLLREDDNQLYFGVIASLLREYRTAGRKPSFSTFESEVRTKCNIKSQEGALQQRLDILKGVVSPMGGGIDGDFKDVCATPEHVLTIVDLSDKLLSREHANSIFQVLAEQFRELGLDGRGKLLVLDEAHKYMDGTVTDGLGSAIVAIARQMRHDNMRLAVSTQDPRTLKPELLELCSVAIMHQFHSEEWFAYVKAKLSLPAAAASVIRKLPQGFALVHAARAAVTSSLSFPGKPNLFRVHIRERATADLGATRAHAGRGGAVERK